MLENKVVNDVTSVPMYFSLADYQQILSLQRRAMIGHIFFSTKENDLEI